MRCCESDTSRNRGSCPWVRRCALVAGRHADKHTGCSTTGVSGGVLSVVGPGSGRSVLMVLWPDSLAGYPGTGSTIGRRFRESRPGREFDHGPERGVQEWVQIGGWFERGGVLLQTVAGRVKRTVPAFGESGVSDRLRPRISAESASSGRRFVAILSRPGNRRIRPVHSRIRRFSDVSTCLRSQQPSRSADDDSPLPSRTCRICSWLHLT